MVWLQDLTLRRNQCFFAFRRKKCDFYCWQHPVTAGVEMCIFPPVTLIWWLRYQSQKQASVPPVTLICWATLGKRLCPAALNICWNLSRYETNKLPNLEDTLIWNYDWHTDRRNSNNLSSKGFTDDNNETLNSCEALNSCLTLCTPLLELKMSKEYVHQNFNCKIIIIATTITFKPIHFLCTNKLEKRESQICRAANIKHRNHAFIVIVVIIMFVNRLNNIGKIIKAIASYSDGVYTALEYLCICQEGQ